MGLISGLLGLPLAPVRGVVWIAERIAEQTEAQFYDESEILKMLAQAEMDNELGRMTDDEYAEVEALLLDRLEEARAYRNAQRGMGEQLGGDDWDQGGADEEGGRST